MVEVEVHWVGLLSNVDSSILGLKILHGFTIKYFTWDEAVQHLFDVEKISKHIDSARIFSDYSCFNQDEERMYYIARTEIMDLNLNEDGYRKSIVIGETEKLYNESIKKIFRLLRLYKDGDIRIPMDYSYYEYRGKIVPTYTRSTSYHVGRDIFHLTEEDIKDLDQFLKIQLPLTPPYLELAFQNYEQAYATHNQVLSFLALMISLEILYNPGGSEIRYRIARNCAVLLGDNKKESEEIFKDVYRIYNIRSRIVHSGDMGELNEELTARTRHYVRESIKDMNQLGESKDEILSKLNTLGFGEIDSYKKNDLNC